MQKLGTSMPRSFESVRCAKNYPEIRIFLALGLQRGVNSSSAVSIRPRCCRLVRV